MVNIERSAAGFTGPAFPFGFNEFAYAVFPDRRKIFEHAHTVLLPVPLVQVLQPLARIFTTAGGTEFTSHLFACRNPTVYAAQPVRSITPAAPVLLPEKCHADRAVHAAGGNQGRLEWIFHHHKCGYATVLLKPVGLYRGGIEGMVWHRRGNRKPVYHTRSEDF